RLPAARGRGAGRRAHGRVPLPLAGDPAGAHALARLPGAHPRAPRLRSRVATARAAPSGRRGGERLVEKLVIIPTYNELENIGTLLDRLLALPHGLDVLVVDDNSPDGTGDLVAQRMAQEPRVHLLRRAGKMGLGSAYREGFRYALDRGAEYIFEMD